MVISEIPETMIISEVSKTVVIVERGQSLIYEEKKEKERKMKRRMTASVLGPDQRLMVLSLLAS